MLCSMANCPVHVCVTGKIMKRDWAGASLCPPNDKPHDAFYSHPPMFIKYQRNKIKALCVISSQNGWDCFCFPVSFRKTLLLCAALSFLTDAHFWTLFWGCYWYLHIFFSILGKFKTTWFQLTGWNLGENEPRAHVVSLVCICKSKASRQPPWWGSRQGLGGPAQLSVLGARPASSLLKFTARTGSCVVSAFTSLSWWGLGRWEERKLRVF